MSVRQAQEAFCLVRRFNECAALVGFERADARADPLAQFQTTSFIRPALKPEGNQRPVIAYQDFTGLSDTDFSQDADRPIPP